MVGRFAVSPDGTRFATGGATVTVFDRDAMAPLWDRPIRHFGLAFSHDNKRLIAATGQWLVALDATTGRSLVEGRSQGDAFGELITSLAVDPGGAWVYAGTFLGKVCAFAADTLELRAVFEWHLGIVHGLAVSADGSRLFSSGGDGCVKVWPVRDLLRGVGEPSVAP